MALTRTREDGRTAFTLVELLVVIGIMAVLATISVAGYSAATRGMADRGVIQSTRSILQIAQQTCEIDRVPTKVFFFNRCLSDGSNEGDAALYQGTAIAIKQAGRITIAPSAVTGLLVDEFADWQQSYPMRGSDQAPGMRIYRMKPGSSGDERAGIDDCSMMVLPFVKSVPLDEELLQSGMYFTDWCTRHKRTSDDNRPEGAGNSYEPNGNNYVWGFKPANSSSGGRLTWKAGDPYGVEIAQIDLPKGYFFGKSAPRKNELESASGNNKEVHFDPEEFEPRPSGGVEVSVVRQDNVKSVGKVEL